MPNVRKRGGMRKPNKKVYKPRAKMVNQNYRFGQGRTFKVKPEPFPRELQTRMKYADQGLLTLSSTPDYASALTYKTNGLYQPLYSTGNTTATGYTTMAALYANYMVMGAKIHIAFYDPSSDGMTVGVRLRSTTQSPVVSSTLRQVITQPMTYTSELNNTGSQKKHFSFYVSPWSLVGMSKLEYLANRTGLSGDFSNNTDPTYPAYFDIFAVHPTAGSTTVRYNVKIVFYVRCFNRKALAYTIY